MGNCALLADGGVVCFGYYYQHPGSLPYRRIALAEKTKQLSCGGQNTCVIDAKDRVFCWFASNPVTEISLPADNPPIRIASGLGNNGCALLSDHTVSCWTNTGIPTPVLLPGPAALVVAGIDDYCARLTADAGSKIYCWGNAQFGTVGDPVASEVRAPQLITVPAPDPASGIDLERSLSGGQAYDCALGGMGDVYCWGSNDGVLGVSSGVLPVSTAPRPVGLGWSDYYGQVLPGALAVSLSSTAGPDECAVTQSGSVECWGASYFGGAGRPAVQVLDDAFRVSSSGANGFVMLNSGAVISWGVDDYSEAGREDIVNTPEPCCGKLDEVE